MKVIDQSHEIISITPHALGIIEEAGRTCYKSERRNCPQCNGAGICEEQAAPGVFVGGTCTRCGGSGLDTKAFVKGVIAKGHHSVLEHASATVRFVTNRGVTHELVRHRLASFAQESTRYCNYSGYKFGDEITVVRPVWMENDFSRGLSPESPDYRWYMSMVEAEEHYMSLLGCGWRPEQAREVLPNSLKTEIVVSANLREWRHILSLRAVGTTGRPHPQMQALMLPLLAEFKERVPVVFDDLVIKD